MANKLVKVKFTPGIVAGAAVWVWNESRPRGLDLDTVAGTGQFFVPEDALCDFELKARGAVGQKISVTLTQDGDEIAHEEQTIQGAQVQFSLAFIVASEA